MLKVSSIFAFVFKRCTNCRLLANSIRNVEREMNNLAELSVIYQSGNNRFFRRDINLVCLVEEDPYHLNY